MMSLIHSFRKNPLESALMFLAFIGAGKALFDLVARILFQGIVPYHRDAFVFFAIGRGILNGLSPYSDLLEVKSPAIFLLSAASLHIFGDMTLARIANIFVIILVPLGMALACWRSTQKSSFIWLRIIAAFLFGVIAVLHVSLQISAMGGVRPEFFGMVFVFMYIVLLLSPFRGTNRQTMFATLCMLGAIGFFEPFVLIVGSIAILACSSFSMAWRLFFLPLICTFFLGNLLLLLFGYFEGYWILHIPFTFGFHLQHSIPFWVRAFSVDQVWESLRMFSPLFGLVVFAPLLFLLSAPSFPSGKKTVLSVLQLGLMGFLSMLLFWRTWRYSFEAPLYYQSILPTNASLLLLLVLAGSLTLFSILRSLSVKDRRLFLFTALRLGGSLYCATFAAGITGVRFQGSSYALLMPFYAVVFLLFLKQSSFVKNYQTALIVHAVTLLLLTLSIFFHEPMFSWETYESRANAVQKEEPLAMSIDAVLDQCNWDRYMLYGNIWPFGYTRHSPYGPVVCPCLFQKAYAFPPLQEKQKQNLREASFIVMGPDHNPPPAEMTLYMDEHFTTKAWDCAETVPVPPDVQFFFRWEK